jgi:hypothetical protein
VADTQRKKNRGPSTARPRTEKAEVSGAYTAGKTDVVERVIDTLTSMFNRRQISQLQYAAGDRYRSAFDMTSASSGGSMDFDRARGGNGTAPVSPALTFLLAAECVSQARNKLYPKDYAIVHRVCIVGLTIEAAAKQLYDERFDGAWDPYLKEAGRKFRVGLENLADMWWPGSTISVKNGTMNAKTGEEIRTMRNIRTERATVTDAVSVAPSSSVAHATRDKVYRGPQRKERA